MFTLYIPQITITARVVPHGDWILVPSATALKFKICQGLKYVFFLPFKFCRCPESRRIKTPKLLTLIQFKFTPSFPYNHMTCVHVTRLNPSYYVKTVTGRSTAEWTSMLFFYCQRQNWTILAVLPFQVLRETSNKSL